MKTFTLQELAELTHSTLIGDPDLIIKGFSDLETANAADIAFFANPKFDRQRYHKAFERTRAGAIFISADTPKGDHNYLINPSPSLAFQKAIEALCQQSLEPTAFPGIHRSAVIHQTAALDPSVTIGPNAVIDKDVTIAANSHIGAGSFIGPHTTIGESCLLHANVTVRERCLIGNRVRIQPGAVIGSCGFGYVTDECGKHYHLKQMGRVIIEDDVDIGANTTIDRARFKETLIKRGTKIDNLVQIGHGVKVGEDNLIVSQTGIAGSTETGKNVVLGGQVAVNGHIKLGDQVMITAKSGVSKSLPKAGKYGGVPVQELSEYNRSQVHLRNIEKIVTRLKKLEARQKSD